MKYLKNSLYLLSLTGLLLLLSSCGGTEDTVEEYANAVSVKSYGAKGDGVADDTQAFKDAFAAETSVLIPDGHYLIKSAIFLPSTLRVITGNGTIIGTGLSGIFTLNFKDKGINQLVINGLTFQYQPTKDTIFGAIYLNDAKVKNLTIKNCHFTSQEGAKWGNAIKLVGKNTGKKKHRLDNITIINNTFTNITRAAIEVLVRGKDTKRSAEFPEWPAVNFDKTIVTNLYIRGNTFKHNRNTYRMPNEIFNPAISLSGAVNGTVIDDNEITGYYWGVELDGSVHTKITNNKITTKHSALSISHGADPEIGKTVIEGNTFSASEEKVINTHGARNINIRKNTIIGLMYLRKSYHLNIEGNKFYSPQYTNIVIEDSLDCIITNNYIENTNTSSNGSIRGKGYSNNTNRVTNNKIYLKAGNGVITNESNASVLFEDNETLSSPQ